MIGTQKGFDFFGGPSFPCRVAKTAALRTLTGTCPRRGRGRPRCPRSQGRWPRCRRRCNKSFSSSSSSSRWWSCWNILFFLLLFFRDGGWKGPQLLLLLLPMLLLLLLSCMCECGGGCGGCGGRRVRTDGGGPLFAGLSLRKCSFSSFSSSFSLLQARKERKQTRKTRGGGSQDSEFV